MEHFLVFIKKYISEHRAKKKDVLVSLVTFTLQETNDFQFIWQKLHPVQLHIQHGEILPREILIEQVNYK